MATVNYLVANSLVGYNKVRSFVGASFTYPPATGVLSDANGGTGIVFGQDAAGAQQNDGQLELGFPNPAALGAGQAIGYVSAADIEAAAGTGAALTVQLASGGPLMWSSGLGGPFLIPSPTGVVSGHDWRTSMTGLHIWAEAWRPANYGGDLAVIAQMRLAYGVYNRPTLAVSAPTGTVSLTSTPQIVWGFSGDTIGQGGYRVRVFTAAQYGIGGFNPESSPSTYDSGVVTSTNTFHQLPAGTLAKGVVYRAYVMAFQALPGSQFKHWTTDGTTLAALGAAAYTGFTFDPAPPATLSFLSPNAGSIWNTDRPPLRAIVEPHPVPGFLSKVQWDFATDAGYTANLRSVIEPDSAFRTAGATLMEMPPAQELFQGQWYIRARAIDQAGTAGPWLLSASSFGNYATITHPPSTAGHVPSGGRSYINFICSWAFSDTSPSDVQTAYQVIIERDSDGFQIADSGKVVSPNQFYSSPSVTSTYFDVLLRWRVRVWDSDDVAGPWSANQQGYMRNYPVLAITYPLTTVTSPAPTVTWTLSLGRTQSAFRVVALPIPFTTLQPGSTPLDPDKVYDSGWVSSSLLYHQIAPVLESGKSYRIAVWARDTFNIPANANVVAYKDISATWIPPDTPAAVASSASYDTLGYITVTWPQNRDGSFSSYQVYRREVGTTEWTLVGTTVDILPTTYVYKDWTAPANKTYEYAVTQIALRYTALVESTPVAINSVSTAGSAYWIISTEDETLNARLNVNSDSYSEQWEQETIDLLGRGRRVERGTRWGMAGSITANVYGNELKTAREIRQGLEAMKSGAVDVWLRNPFGDVWRVALGDLQIDRVAGVGTNEYFSMTVEYTEVI